MMPPAVCSARTDAKGQTATFKYDLADRLVEKRLSDGKVVTYEYDAFGNVVPVDDGRFPSTTATTRQGA